MTTNPRIFLQSGHALAIDTDKMVKVIQTQNITEIIAIKNPSNNLANYRKLNKHECINLSNGELVHFKSKTRQQNSQSLNRSFQTLRRIINDNFWGEDSERHIVLTYANFISDYHQVCHDFKKFWARFKHHYPSCEYIRILEPQQSGRWHIHLLVKSVIAPLYIHFKHLRKLWGYGRVRVERFPFATNYGAYFCARFANKEDSSEYDTDKNTAIKKGERLHFYPDHFRVYTCSKGIRRPIAETMPYGQAKQQINNVFPCFSYTNHVMLEDEQGNQIEVNSITYEQFKNR